MKIPFSIDFKTQIESGEYKVETRDGRKARIIHWDLNCTSPIVAVMDAHIDLPGEIVDVFSVSGRAFDDLESPSDLFLITPEQELSEFEKGCIRLYQEGRDDGFAGDNLSDEILKESATELLALARKELEPEVLERLDVAYKNQDEVVYENGKRDGKAEALKGLPRWRKWENGACGGGQGIPIAIVKRGLNGYELVDSLGIQGEQYIMLSNLEKLPKED